MYAGIIAPIPELDLVRGRKFHLCLSHLCEDLDYLNFYRREAQEGAFITLDNSAHETGAGQDIFELLDRAQQIGASEIVLPDELFESEGTLRRTREALSQLYLLRRSRPASQSRLMFVPQGSIADPREYHSCLSDLVESFFEYLAVFSGGLTIGFSKDYEVYPGGMIQLVHRAMTSVRSRPIFDLDYHLLGWGRDLSALEKLSNLFPSKIRSTDSAKPIMFALAEIDLTNSLDVRYPGRVDNYFYQSLTPAQRKLAKRNISVFETLARRGSYDFVR